MTTRTAPVPSTPELVRRSLTGRRANVVDGLVAFGLLATLLFALLVLATLLTDVVVKSIPVWQSRGAGFVTGTLSADVARTGIFQGVMGSLALTGIVIVVAFPLGVAAAIYLEEYARDTRLTRFIGANIRNLAGVPSIVYGILGLFLFVQVLMQGVFGQSGGIQGRNVIAGGLTLSALVLPIVIITTAEALRAVPLAIREASFGVGATRWETIRHHVLPVAIPAVLTGAVLAVARAFGETAPLLLAGAQLSLFFAVAGDAGLTDLLVDQPYTALPVVVYNFARQPGEEWVALSAAAILVLLVMLLAVNAAAVLARDHFERRR